MLRIFQNELVFNFKHKAGTLEVINTKIKKDVTRNIVYFNGVQTDIEWPYPKHNSREEVFKRFLLEAIFGLSDYNKEKLVNFYYEVFPELAL